MHTYYTYTLFYHPCHTYLVVYIPPSASIYSPHLPTSGRFSAALARLKTGEMKYKPGTALTLDEISIFPKVNSAIQSYRRWVLPDTGRNTPPWIVDTQVNV